jgi:hypothetical protein
MLRRVADVLGASVHVEIQAKQQPPPVVAEAKAIDRVKGKDGEDKRGRLQNFEMDFSKEEKVDLMKNFHIVEALYKEAVTLGVIPLKNPLEGIEVDLKIAQVVNSV